MSELCDLSLEQWENKIDPAIFDLQKSEGVRKINCLIDNLKIKFLGNDLQVIHFLTPYAEEKNKIGPVFKSELNLYIFCGLTDLAILRRIKEYPDETDRSEIEAAWSAECRENGSLIIVNARPLSDKV